LIKILNIATSKSKTMTEEEFVKYYKGITLSAMKVNKVLKGEEVKEMSNFEVYSKMKDSKLMQFVNEDEGREYAEEHSLQIRTVQQTQSGYMFTFDSKEGSKMKSMDSYTYVIKCGANQESITVKANSEKQAQTKIKSIAKEMKAKYGGKQIRSVLTKDSKFTSEAKSIANELNKAEKQRSAALIKGDKLMRAMMKEATGMSTSSQEHADLKEDYILINSAVKPLFYASRSINYM